MTARRNTREYIPGPTLRGKTRRGPRPIIVPRSAALPRAEYVGTAAPDPRRCPSLRRRQRRTGPAARYASDGPARAATPRDSCRVRVPLGVDTAICPRVTHPRAYRLPASCSLPHPTRPRPKQSRRTRPRKRKREGGKRAKPPPAARLRRHHRLIGEADAPPSPAWPAAYSAALISALAEARAGDRFGLAGR